MQVQLRVAEGLAGLLAEPSLHKPASVTVLNNQHVQVPESSHPCCTPPLASHFESTLEGDLYARLSQVCSSFVEIGVLFSLAQQAGLWRALLAILDFARPYKEYPDVVAGALKKLLAPAIGLEWQSLLNEVALLRKAHPNAYIFQACG